MASWGFYGRTEELRQLAEIFARKRWFFVNVTGRRRIGKTALIHEALKRAGGRPVFYVQIPDSSPVGVLSAVHDAMETFHIDPTTYPRPRSLLEFSKTISALAIGGYVVTLDEFQYFNRERLRDFCSLMQAEVDRLTGEVGQVTGGLVVLGSRHTELSALLEDRSAPLYSRTTHEIQIRHLDIAAIMEILRVHATPEPERLLFLWNLFEGVPKFYRDCYEQGVLRGWWDRADTEIDLLAVDEKGRRIRFGSCKRSADKLIADLLRFSEHIARFLNEKRAFQSWNIERVCIAPAIPEKVRGPIQGRGFLAEDLADLTHGL